MTEPTQNARVLAFLKGNPGATALDIAHGLHPWCSNPRARISDLRAAGYVIEPRKRDDGKTGFVVTYEPGADVQLALAFR